MTARHALRQYASRLHVSAADFRFESVRHSLVGVHVRGRQYRGAVPVDGTSVAVHIVRGQVWQVEARGTKLAGKPIASPISSSLAVSTALKRLGVQTPALAPRVERLMVRQNERLVDAYRVTVFSLAPAVAAEVDVSSADGSALAVRDTKVELDGSATVFDPNPVVTLRDNTLRTPGVDQAGLDTDLDGDTLTSALRTLPLQEVDSTALAAGKLTGPWVNVQGPAPLGVSATFTFTRGDPRFETTMAYAHLDRVQRYIQSLGFTGDAGVNAESQDIYTLPVLGFDNSFYVQGMDFILYGAGGVDDAEDAEVILHEYGHAIQDAQVPGWGETEEGGAMGEGWGDFLAGAFYAGSISGGFQDVCIADWDSTSYSSTNPPCLRRLDSQKHYPADMEDEVHDDGEMWSAFLWRLRDDLGGSSSPTCTKKNCKRRSQQKTDRILTLVLTSHEFLTPTADFGDGVAALRLAAAALGHSNWGAIIDREATWTGFPLN
jgi:hypothetical protein